MAEVIKIQYQLRRGLAATWAKNNPVLAYGEPGFEKDTYRVKIGDGETAWNDLAYFGGSGSVIVDGDSIDIVDGKIELPGFKAAGTGFLATKAADGSLTWTDKISIEMLDVPEGVELVIGDN